MGGAATLSLATRQPTKEDKSTMDTAHAGSARQRRPSMAQRPLLEALADLGGTATAGEIVDRVQRAGARKPGVDQWIAVESAGWCT
ncbi:MAG TPA: hypothetical protein VJT31_23865, partial [Rugosimonospora sp.]|nr:hypothetical protein [Rugosimonospora sp.]